MREQTATVLAIVLFLAISTAVYAEDAQDESFDYMVWVLTEANDLDVLSDAFIEVLLDVLGSGDQTSFDYLISVLMSIENTDLWNEQKSQLLAELVVEYLIAPKTGETPEQASKRLLAESADPFSKWNRLEPLDWWTPSEPYSCSALGTDPLSLIKYFGNGSYLKFGYMGFSGCTPTVKYPDRTYLDPPVDPKYYSLGDLTISVDIVRVPSDAPGWFEGDGKREDMTMVQAVQLLNENVARYYRKISEGKLRIEFVPGLDFELEGEGRPEDVHDQQMRLAGIMDCHSQVKENYPCNQGAPGGLNRILLTDVTSDTGGDAFNGSARMGLVSLRIANMETIVHEIGHAWMNWPHSYAEVLLWDPYSNRLDFMSGLNLPSVLGWYQDMPSTLAVNRYSAGWIDPSEVAVYSGESGMYHLQPPRKRGYQFLVIPSGRDWAFTTVEVLDERNAAYRDEPGLRYQGVLVSRYDQTAGTATRARFGPALGEDSVVWDGESRDLGGVRLSVSENPDGSYQVEVRGSVAEFKPWCEEFWFKSGEYDTGCALAQ